jgi:hypothetical protein
VLSRTARPIITLHSDDLVLLVPKCQSGFTYFVIYLYLEEITAENEEEIARARFQQLLNERERDRIAAPWLTAAAAPRLGSPPSPHLSFSIILSKRGKRQGDACIGRHRTVAQAHVRHKVALNQETKVCNGTNNDTSMYTRYDTSQLTGWHFIQHVKQGREIDAAECIRRHQAFALPS